MILQYSNLKKYKNKIGNKAYNFSIIQRNRSPKGIVIYEKNKELNKADSLKIKKWLETNKSAMGYAIRSSTISEDTRKTSNAGVSKSFIRIKKGDVLKKINNCLVGADCVLLQVTVNAKVSGVCFSEAKIGNEFRIYAEVSKGFCDKVVLGNVQEKIFLNKEVEIPVFFSKLLSEKEQILLRREVLKLESLFGYPQDIEFSFSKDNKLYILQSRDISRKVILQDHLTFSHSRDDTLFKIKLNEKINSEDKFLRKHNIAFKSFCIFDKEAKNYEFFIKETEIIDIVSKRKILAKNTKFLDFILKNYDKNILEINKLEVELRKGIFNKQKFEKTLHNFIMSLDLFITFSYVIENKQQEKRFTEKRKKTQIYSYMPNKLINYAYSMNWLKEKEKKFHCYHNNKFYSKAEFKKYMNKNNLSFWEDEVENNNGIFNGDIVVSKKVKGKIQFVYNANDIKKFKDGRILVTNDITPKFYSILDKAKGIIAEEGGHLSHAAITAREKGLPCIIGVDKKIRLLKNGDMVEINPKEKFVRKIIGKNKK